MNEQLINLKTAKLVKEKGFDIPVYYHYSENPINNLEILCEPDDPQMGQGWILTNYNDNNLIFKKYSAPTQSLLQRWLREIHNIHLEINVNILREWSFTGYDLTEKRCSEIPALYEAGKDLKCNSYEEALEIGLQKTLKLIKEIK